MSNYTLNNHNKSKQENTTSKFIGVHLERSSGKYIAKIKKEKKSYFIGRFETEEKAAEEYNKKSIELYGKYANLNTF